MKRGTVRKRPYRSSSRASTPINFFLSTMFFCQTFLRSVPLFLAKSVARVKKPNCKKNITVGALCATMEVIRTREHLLLSFLFRFFFFFFFRRARRKGGSARSLTVSRGRSCVFGRQSTWINVEITNLSGLMLTAPNHSNTQSRK